MKGKGIEHLLWLLIAFLLGIGIGLYWGGVRVEYQLRKAQAEKHQMYIE